jgi:hypothetical protein
MANFLNQLSLVATTLFLAACAAPTQPQGPSTATVPEAKPKAPPAAAAVPASEREALALLILGAKPNPVKTCMTAALRQNMVLVFMKLIDTPDDTVRSKLVGNAKGSLLALREKQATAWRAGASTGELAQMEFNHCLSSVNISMSSNPVAKTCFDLAALPAFAEAEKTAKHDSAGAVARLQAAYAHLPADYVKSTTEKVFAADADKDDFKAHRQVFAECFLNVK